VTRIKHPQVLCMRGSPQTWGMQRAAENGTATPTAHRAQRLTRALSTHQNPPKYETLLSAK
jgi:hypothetical protein